MYLQSSLVPQRGNQKLAKKYLDSQQQIHISSVTAGYVTLLSFVDIGLILKRLTVKLDSSLGVNGPFTNTLALDIKFFVRALFVFLTLLQWLLLVENYDLHYNHHHWLSTTE